MFERLGRDEWVRHCDDLLGTGSRGHRSGTQPASPSTGTGPGHAGTGSGHPGAGQAYGAAFDPTGRWDVRVMDAIGSTIDLDLRHDGTFHATQRAGFGAITLQAEGQWIFNPINQWLQVQGLIGGFQPFMLGIAIQGQHQGGYYGVGTDGIAYVLTRC